MKYELVYQKCHLFGDPLHRKPLKATTPGRACSEGAAAWKTILSQPKKEGDTSTLKLVGVLVSKERKKRKQ